MEDKSPEHMEQASRELRLAEQSIFRQTLEGTRGRYRRLIMWITVACVGVLVVWTFAMYPALHHQLGWCPAHHNLI